MELSFLHCTAFFCLLYLLLLIFCCRCRGCQTGPDFVSAIPLVSARSSNILRSPGKNAPIFLASQCFSYFLAFFLVILRFKRKYHVHNPTQCFIGHPVAVRTRQMPSRQWPWRWRRQIARSWSGTLASLHMETCPTKTWQGGLNLFLKRLGSRIFLSSDGGKQRRWGKTEYYIVVAEESLWTCAQVDWFYGGCTHTDFWNALSDPTVQQNIAWSSQGQGKFDTWWYGHLSCKLSSAIGIHRNEGAPAF